MMPMERQVCNIDLSKELRDLGFPQESAFYWVKFNDEWIFWCWKELQIDSMAEARTREHISAFTVAELGEMLPKDYYSQFNGDQWMCLKDAPRIEFADTEADERAKMLIYLIKEGLIKPEANHES